MKLESDSESNIELEKELESETKSDIKYESETEWTGVGDEVRLRARVGKNI